jgi:hypothetical protein
MVPKLLTPIDVAINTGPDSASAQSLALLPVTHSDLSGLSDF